MGSTVDGSSQPSDSQPTIIEYLNFSLDFESGTGKLSFAIHNPDPDHERLSVMFCAPYQININQTSIRVFDGVLEEDENASELGWGKDYERDYLEKNCSFKSEIDGYPILSSEVQVHLINRTEKRRTVSLEFSQFNESFYPNGYFYFTIPNANLSHFTSKSLLQINLGNRYLCENECFFSINRDLFYVREFLIFDTFRVFSSISL